MPDLHLFERRPDPPTAKVNAITLFVTGTVVWIVATIVVAVLGARGAVPDRLLDICFAGLGLGLLGMAWGYVHESRVRRRSGGTPRRTA